jgi:DNA repair exonuclease SbcCD ATPase subunit
MTAVTVLETEKGKTENLGIQLMEKEEALIKAVKEQAEAKECVNHKLKELKELIGDKDPDALEKELTENLGKAEEAVKTKEKQIAELKELLAGLNGKIQTLKDRQQQDQGVLEEKVQQLSHWLADYNADESHVQKLAVEDIMDLSESTDNWEAIRQEKEKKNQTHTSAETTYRNEVEAHEAHQQSKPMEEKDALVVKKQELEMKDHSELIGAKARMQRYQVAKKAMGDMYDQKQKTEQVMKDWVAISDAVGGSDGKLLRKIAQCYTLRFLVEHANAEIRKFNQRYELVQVKNSLGIRVIDHDRADDIRDTTSLSGGETFIVSLGLALGLSALSSRSISFENLFIDEGFGTLDPDTLATVIDSLAMLQTSQGKKVGVISHTDTMSERITTQIRVVKNGNSGSSHIEIYP